jgi:hypothetical protein
MQVAGSALFNRKYTVRVLVEGLGDLDITEINLDTRQNKKVQAVPVLLFCEGRGNIYLAMGSG